MDKPYDIFVIGGGINGAGIARDAAGRGLSVLLAEKGDLASATSSASSKLIHGGLRYLEYYEFGLVRKALKEREILLKLAPHIIWPLDFILPHDRTLRPAWMIRAGLFLYDHLARRVTLPGSARISLTEHPAGRILRDRYRTAFRYSDCWVDDARLVVLNALDARERGADIRTRTRCSSLVPLPERKLWRVDLEQIDGRKETVFARDVVNAAGPWVHSFLEANGLVTEQTPALRLVKGSHIVVPRIYDGTEAFILQQPDGRIVFVLPYEQEFSLVGTTEEPVEGDPAAAAISGAETDYLCEAVGRSFYRRINPRDVVWTFSGVRPLLDSGEEDASSVTRDYRLVLSDHDGCRLLNVFGGKITTYRTLAEEATGILTSAPAWTAGEPLPGGDMEGGFSAFLRRQEEKYPWLPGPLLLRYARAYGTRMDTFLEGAKRLEDLGLAVGEGLYEVEVAYLRDAEFALEPDDILWRRTKIGLKDHGGPELSQILAKFG